LPTVYRQGGVVKRFGILLIAALAGCAQPKAHCTTCVHSTYVEPAIPNPSTPASSAEYAPFLRGGTGSLTGQAFLRTVGGEVRLAAGRPATLDPVTAYSREWWRQRGRESIGWFTVAAPDSLFVAARREVTVNAQGGFHFDGLAPGWYYVRSLVTWEVAGKTQGGVVGDSVLVRSGSTTEIILTR
jgi:hypothetical protein